MVSKIKETLQEQLVKKRYRWYQEQIAKQQLSYDEWIREKERQEREERQFLGKQYKLSVVSYDECRADFSFENYKNADIIVFHAPDGTPDMRELAFVSDFFERFPVTVIAYGDEDEIDEKGVRTNVVKAGLVAGHAYFIFLFWWIFCSKKRGGQQFKVAG